MKNFLRLSGAATAIAAVLSPAFASSKTTTSQDGEDVIIVTASPLERSLDDAVLGTSVLEGDDLARSQAGTIGETLRTEPGISSTYFGAGASRPIIRGQGGNRVRVLDNGIGSIDASSASPDHAVAAEPAMAERIEILRGTGLLRYGSSGAGGVVNVIDGRIPQETPENGIEGALRIGGSTVDDGQEAAGGVTFKAGELGGVDILLHAEGTWREADDYEIPGFAESSILRAMEEEEHGEEEHAEEEHGDEHGSEEEAFGVLENSFVESESVAGGISFVGERGFLGFAVKNLNTEYGIPGGHEHAHGDEEEGHEEEEHGEEEEGGVFIELEQTRYDLNGRLDIGGSIFSAINLFAGYADYKHSEIERSGEVGTTFTNEGWEARAELLQTERTGWRGATGIQLRQREFSAIGEEAFVPPTETDEVGVYTFQEWKTGPVLLEAALRYENTVHEDRTNNVERDFNGVSISAGANYDLTENLALSGTAFRTERAPTTEELFSNGPHLATSQFELGSLDLDKEIATGIEAIVHLHGERGFLTFNAFYTNYQDYIYEAETGEEEDELPVFQFTGADANFSGFEVEGQTLLGSAGGFDMTADAVVDFVNAELDEGGNLPRIPPLSATIGLEAENSWLSLRGEVEHAAEQDEVADFELPTESYTLLNAYVSVAPFQSMPNVRLRLSGLNLTDEDARQHTSFLKDVVPLPGRNVRFSIETRF